ncbi:queuosine precursor transporter [Stetteria hydrogenophila]
MGSSEAKTPTLSDRDLAILLTLSGLFGGAIVLANIMAGVKIGVWKLGFLTLVVPAGTVAYSITFPITDIVDEVYGKRPAIYIVWGGLAAELGMFILIPLGQLVPALSEEMQELYSRVFSPQYRIVLGSIVAYLVSQHHDVWAFWKWREVTHGKWLWLRNNASTIVSQLIDSTLFSTIAFTSVLPASQVVSMILTMWAAKIIVALADTPFVYLGVWLITRGQKPAPQPRLSKVAAPTL